MRIFVFKNVNYYGVFEKGQYCPVTANSIEKLKENAIEEIYRYSAFCEKKVPNDSDKIEIILTKSVNEVFCENTFSLLSITEFKNSLEGFTGQLGQAKERIGKLKDRSSETTALEERKEE